MTPELTARLTGLRAYYPEGNRIKVLLDTVIADGPDAAADDIAAVIAEFPGSTVAKLLSQVLA